MKPRNNSTILRTHQAGATLATIVSVCFSAMGIASAIQWDGSTDIRWNDATNWAGDVYPGGDGEVNTATGNLATISEDMTPGPVDIIVGNTATGILNHTAGLASTGTNNWFIVGRAGQNGTYNMADVATTGGLLTNLGLGSGSTLVGGASPTNGRLYVGDNGIGTVNMNTSGTLTVRNDFNLGAGTGTGTFNMDAGTMTTGGWNFIGNGNGSSGTFNQSGGGFTNTGRTYIGGRNAGGTSNSFGSYNVSGGLNTNNQQFSVGSGNLANAATSVLTVSGSGTLNAGGTSIGGAAFVGADANPGKGTATLSGNGTINVNGELWVGQSLASVGSFTISGGNLNVNNWIAIGRENGTGSVNMSGGTLTKTGAGNLIIAASGPGSMVHTGGLVDVQNGVTWIAETNNSVGTLDILGTAQFNVQSLAAAVNPGTTATITMSGGNVTMGGNNEVQIGARGVGVWNQSAGTVNSSGWNVIGRYNVAGASGAMNLSGGTFNQTQLDRNMIVGEETTGILTVSGTGILNASADNGISIANGATGIGTINLNGGSITAKSVHEGAAGSSTFNFNGGQLIAGAGANLNFMTGIDTVVIKSGGALINSSGNNISINPIISDDATNGTLTKTGAGALYLNGVNTYLGATLVNTGTIGGNGVIQGAVTLAAGTTISPGVTTGILTAGSANLSAGATLAVDIIGTAPVAADRLNVNGNLNITNSTLTLSGTPTAQRYVIAQYGSRTGTFTSVPALPSGYTLNYAYQGNKIVIERLALTAFDTFINGFFPGNQDDPSVVGPDADPDGDGTRNSIEYALGGNPSSGSDGPKVYQILADSSDAGTAKELLITIAVLNGTPAFSGSPSPTATQSGFTYTVQGSLDLIDFTSPVSVVTTVVPTDQPTPPTGYTYRTFSLDASDNLPSRGFLRVRITP